MRRREFITFLCGMALALAFTSRAQPAPDVAIVGVLSPFSASTAAPWHKAFTEGLRELGWIEGKNIRIEYRYAEGRARPLPELAADLVRQRVNVIVTRSTLIPWLPKPRLKQFQSSWHLRGILLAAGL